MDKTAEILDAMLKENTGRALLDSGDYYGRHWQQNQGRDFEKGSQSVLRFDCYGDSERKPEISLTHSVYHWLKSKLTYDEEMDHAFTVFAEREENEDEHWLTLMETFAEKLPTLCDEHDGETECTFCDFHGREVTGIYGDGKPTTTNTYNGEDLLSQTIQFTYFEIDDQGYVLLQIHGGCDARGGYTRPRAFTVNDDLGIFDNARGSIGCSGRDIVKYGCGAGHTWTSSHINQTEACPTCLLMAVTRHEDTEYHVWDTDDGCHFDDQSYPGPKYELLKEWVVIGADPDDARTVTDVFKPGVTVVDANKKEGYCPHCAAPLSGGF